MNKIYSFEEVLNRPVKRISVLCILWKKKHPAIWQFKDLLRNIPERFYHENIFKDIFLNLSVLDDVDTKTLCIDGTKLEANATRILFCMKKTMVKTRDKTFTHINDEIRNWRNHRT